jgi:hypothetical protein
LGFDLDSPDPDVIAVYFAVEFAGAKHDIQSVPDGPVGGRFLAVVLLVVLASCFLAFGRVDPKVGATRIENDLEGVAFVANGELARILSILEVEEVDGFRQADLSGCLGLNRLDRRAVLVVLALEVRLRSGEKVEYLLG